MFRHPFIAGLLAVLTLFTGLPLQAEPVELDRIVAIVNDQAISETELNNTVKTLKLQMGAGQLPPDAVLREQVLDQLIMKHLQQQLAASNNIVIDEETLNRALNSIAEQNNLSLARLRAILENDGIDFNVYREEIRHEILQQRLRQRYVNNRINITDTEVDQFLAQQKLEGASEDEYHIGHILIDLPADPAAEDIDAARQRGEELLQLLAEGEAFDQVAMRHSDGQQALSGGDLGWRKLGELPALFANALAELEPGQTSDLIRSPSGFHILRLIETRGGERHMVSQTRARHILIKTNELVDDRSARERLRELQERLENGEDFAVLARAHSDDKASAAKGGELGWTSPGQMVPAFEAAMDRLEAGEISEPFQSRFGWHIVEVLERRRHDDTESFYRNQARKQLFERKAVEEEQLWLRRLRDEAYIEIRL